MRASETIEVPVPGQIARVRQREEDLVSEQPELAKIAREKVKPGRDELGSNPNNVPLKRRWWAYQAHRPELYSRILEKKRVLACSQVSSHLAFDFLPSDWIYSHKLVVLDIDCDSDFCVVQCRVHEIWTRLLSSTLEDRLNYSPSDCFATFPFPKRIEIELLKSVGKEYRVFRSGLLVETNLGLTKTYNRFHSPDELDGGILELRRLHGLMVEAVLRAYGWDDLADTATCEFLLDYEEEEDEEPGARRSNRKKPWRYRWPDEFRDEVLARLLELNEQRHREEVKAGKASALAGDNQKKEGVKSKPKQGVAPSPGQQEMGF